MPSRILVTGGCGFIGRAVCAALSDAGTQVAIIDIAAAGCPRGPANADLIHGDIRDRRRMIEIVTAVKPDAILHLAALHHIPTCIAHPHRTLDINVTGTQALLDAAAEAATPLVVLASSGAVYEWLDGPLTEDRQTRPHDIYAVSKLANEQQLEIWTRQAPGLRRGRIARLFNVIGPGDPNAHLIPDMMARLAAAPRDGKPVPLSLGHLDRRRDYLHVQDAAGGLVALLADEDPTPFIIENLCSGIELSVVELAQRLAVALGIEVICHTEPELRRPLDRPSQWGSAARIRHRLGWRPRHSVEEALALIAASQRAPAKP